MEEKKAAPGKKDDTDRITSPITYPDHRFEKTNVAMPSDSNVEEAKNWVDHNTK